MYGLCYRPVIHTNLLPAPQSYSLLLSPYSLAFRPRVAKALAVAQAMRRRVAWLVSKISLHFLRRLCQEANLR
jgi:hypothetical protein